MIENCTKIAIYPGTFDPITFGHIDIIKQAIQFVDKLIVAVAIDNTKKTLLPVENRCKLVRQEVSVIDDKIEVTSFSGLLVDFVQRNNAKLIIRGIRSAADFEFENQMYFMNKKSAPEIITLFLLSSSENRYISSSFVKEFVKLKGNCGGFISDNVYREIRKFCH